MVVFISAPNHQTCHNSTVDQADCAVVEKEQVVGHLSYRRAAGITVSSNCQQKLVLGGGKASGMRLALTPAFEMPESRA